jgi:hypothetical protein
MIPPFVCIQGPKQEQEAKALERPPRAGVHGKKILWQKNEVARSCASPKEFQTVAGF